MVSLQVSSSKVRCNVRYTRQPHRHVAASAQHKICVLPGDGIGPEIMEVATALLHAAGKKTDDSFTMDEHLIGGAAIDVHDSPYPSVTEDACKQSDAVLLAAIGGYELFVTLNTFDRFRWAHSTGNMHWWPVHVSTQVQMGQQARWIEARKWTAEFAV